MENKLAYVWRVCQESGLALVATPPPPTLLIAPCDWFVLFGDKDKLDAGFPDSNIICPNFHTKAPPWE